MARAAKAILFDLDGVIVDSEPIHHRAYDLALESLGKPPIPFEEYAEHFTSRGEGLAWSVAHRGVDAGELHRRKQAIYPNLLRQGAALCSGADAAIRSLAERHTLAVATNSPRAEASYVLERFGLVPCFRAVVGREDYVRAKPEADPFLAAAERLAVAAADCIVVEDSFKGVSAAVAAGMRCVAVPNAYTRWADLSAATLRIESLDDLEAAVARLSRHLASISS